MGLVMTVITIIFCNDLTSEQHYDLIAASFDRYHLGTVLIRHCVFVVIKSHK